MTSSVALAALLVLSPPTWAAETSVLNGSDFLDQCNHKGGGSDWCLGYVLGISEWLVEDGTLGGIRACIPRTVNAGQLRAIAIKFVKENPDMWHLPARYSVSSAILRVFRCK